MILVGLTGGIASGKSTASSIFKELGAYIIDADVLAREVVEPLKPAWKDVVKNFGKGILNKDNSKNVKRLMKRDGLTKDEAIKRIEAQMPLREKVRFADYVIDGNKALNMVKKQLKTALKGLRER